MIYVYELIFLLLNTAIAIIQARRFNSNIPIGPWYHTLWVSPVVASIIAVFFLTNCNWKYACLLCTERAIYFNQVLNLLRKPQKPFFYLDSAENGSWIDSILLKINIFYPIIWVISVILFILAQFEIYKSV